MRQALSSVTSLHNVCYCCDQWGDLVAPPSPVQQNIRRLSCLCITLLESRCPSAGILISVALGRAD